MLETDAAPLQLALVAGEASGDLLAGLLLAGLRLRWPRLSASGIGGPNMAAQGFSSHWPMDRLSVFGYVDALKRLPELLRMRRALCQRLLQERPALFVGVDAPDFNFALETRLRQTGIKTVHFVCPSIWAWRADRVQRLKRAADHVLCLFPFEPALLQQHGIAASYVGHPLADAIALDDQRAVARAALGLDAQASVVALLPGSRPAEVQHLAARMAAASRLMLARRPGLLFLLPAAPGLQAAIHQQIGVAGPAPHIRVLPGQSQLALAACDVAIVASGTATLEAALFKRPMVITYHLSWLNWQRMRRMSLQPWYGLPNILARDFVVPELVQDAATPQALASAALDWLEQPQRLIQLQQRFTDLHHQLRQNTARKAGDAITQVLAA